jgi:hypothetical protein
VSKLPDDFETKLQIDIQSALESAADREVSPFVCEDMAAALARAIQFERNPDDVVNINGWTKKDPIPDLIKRLDEVAQYVSELIPVSDARFRDDERREFYNANLYEQLLANIRRCRATCQSHIELDSIPRGRPFPPLHDAAVYCTMAWEMETHNWPRPSDLKAIFRRAGELANWPHVYRDRPKAIADAIATAKKMKELGANLDGYDWSTLLEKSRRTKT